MFLLTTPVTVNRRSIVSFLRPRCRRRMILMAKTSHTFQWPPGRAVVTVKCRVHRVKFAWNIITRWKKKNNWFLLHFAFPVRHLQKTSDKRHRKKKNVNNNSLADDLSQMSPSRGLLSSFALSHFSLAILRIFSKPEHFHTFSFFAFNKSYVDRHNKDIYE